MNFLKLLSEKEGSVLTHDSESRIIEKVVRKKNHVLWVLDELNCMTILGFWSKGVTLS